MTYTEFLESKIAIAPETGLDISPEEVNPALLSHQRDGVLWAVRGAGGQRGLGAGAKKGQAVG